jgi:hypothetical protein
VSRRGPGKERVTVTSKYRTDETDLNSDALSRVETIFIVNNLFVMQNGINQSIVRKMKFMEEAWGYRPLLLVAEYNADEDLQRAFSENAYADAARFSQETFLKNWASFTETMYKRKVQAWRG